MRTPRLPLALLATAAMCEVVLVAATLEPQTRDAYLEYIERLDARNERHADERITRWIDADARRQQRLLRGDILAEAGNGDGILDVPEGLIHHWVGAVFLRDVRLAQVVSVVQDYESYPRVHAPVVRAELLNTAGNTRRYYLRLRQGTRFATAVLDTWWTATDRLPVQSRMYASARADRIQQVNNADEENERLLPEGVGVGYLWLAHTYSAFVEADGGTYAEFETVGLSRPFPRLLAWVIGPIARAIGERSVAQTLREIRDEVEAQTGSAPNAAAD